MAEFLKRVDLIFGEYSDEKYKTLEKTIKRPNDDIIKDILDSGLRGRGGAGFPTAMKWKFTMEQPGDEKYVICNADEGEPGTFKDREILTQVPRKVFAGMAICGKVIGAKKGYIYLRGEYRFLLPDLLEEIDDYNETAKELGIDFTIEIRMGSGAYICGEESAFLNPWKVNAVNPGTNLPILPLQVTSINPPLSIMLKHLSMS